MTNETKIVEWLKGNSFTDASKGGITMLDRNVWSHGNEPKVVSGIRVAFGVDEVSVTCFAGKAGWAPVVWEARFTSGTPSFVVAGTVNGAISG